jgi:hypothetical protein
VDRGLRSDAAGDGGVCGCLAGARRLISSHGLVSACPREFHDVQHLPSPKRRGVRVLIRRWSRRPCEDGAGRLRRAGRRRLYRTGRRPPPPVTEGTIPLPQLRGSTLVLSPEASCTLRPRRLRAKRGALTMKRLLLMTAIAAALIVAGCGSSSSSSSSTSAASTPSTTTTTAKKTHKKKKKEHKKPKPKPKPATTTATAAAATTTSAAVTPTTTTSVVATPTTSSAPPPTTSAAPPPTTTHSSSGGSGGSVGRRHDHQPGLLLGLGLAQGLAGGCVRPQRPTR